MTPEEEVQAYCLMGIPEEDVAIHEVNGERRTVLSAHGTRLVIEMQAAEDQGRAPEALQWLEAEEAFQIEQGTDPRQAEQAAVRDALEAIGGARTIFPGGPE